MLFKEISARTFLLKDLKFY